MNPALLPNELVLLSQPAKLLLGMEEAAPAPAPAIGPFGAMQSTAALLSRSIESQPLEGELFLTNYRFYFVTRGANWAEGSYSIFLPTVRKDEESDRILSDEFDLQSQSGTHRFVVKDAHAFIEALHDPARPAPDAEVLRIYVTAELDRVSSGMAGLWKGTHPTPEVLAGLEAAVDAKEANALQALGVLTALELFVS